MQEQDQPRAIDRRRLLRRAGAAAAGAAGVTVAGAVVAAPAQAAAGGSLVLGATNDSTDNSTGTAVATTTTLTGGDATHPTLALGNPAGPALAVTPATSIAPGAPAGSVFVDNYGDVLTVGDIGSGPFINQLYSPTWAMMPIPLYPDRYMVTSTTTGRAHVVAGSATYDSAGRLVPRNQTNGADLVLDLSPYLTANPGYVALQCNLTAVNAVRAGWATMWSGDVAPLGGINFQAGQAITNYVQTLVHPTNATVSIKVNASVLLIVDILGLVVSDPYAQIQPSATSTKAMTTASTNPNAQLLERFRKRPIQK